MTMVDYTGRRVVVTGCSSGIGGACARMLLDLGAEVHGFDLRPSGLPLHRFTVVDLRDPDAIAAAAAEAGAVDRLFNCAGVPPGPAALDVMKVNFLGLRDLTAHLLGRMGEGGAIVSVASNGGAGWPDRLDLLKRFVATASFAEGAAWYEERIDSLPMSYSASKEAIAVWTMAMAVELVGRGIRVNCTSPGAVQTPMLEEIEKVTPAAMIDTMAQPIGRRSSPEEQAAALLFLNCDAASYLSGVVLPVDGGYLAARTLGALATPAAPARG